MTISSLNIKIIDTHENTVVLEEQFTESGGVQFLYNGGSDRFSTLVASELHFNMLVPNSVDGYFLYLFTGNETHFKVELEDNSNPLAPVTLWTGFLLPEQFAEPYTNNAFFCSFIATDGLGRIKNLALPYSFFNLKKGVSVVFADCLKMTGLNLPIYIAPAIVNSVTNLNYSQIAVNTAAYVDKNKYLNPYTIIENLLTSMGCKLLQFKGYWYIIGINRMTETTIVFEEYDANGVYVQQTSIARPATDIVFLNSPSVSIQPPFKKVTVNWDKNQDDSILPTDITYQLSDEPIVWNATGNVKHWIKNNENFYTGLSSLTQLVNFVFLQDDYLYQPMFDMLPTEDPFNLMIMPATIDNLDTNYISLTHPVFLKVSPVGPNILTFDVEFIYWCYTDITAAFEAGDYDASFKYELLFNDVVICSNKEGFIGWEGFDFELRLEEYNKIIGTMQLKSIPITEDGFLDIRIMAPVNVEVADRVVYKKIDITYNTEDETLTRTRAIDFTTSQTVDVFHCDDKMDVTIRQWQFTDDVTFSETISGAAGETNIPIVELYTVDVPAFFYEIQYVIISKESYDLINETETFAKLKRAATGLYEGSSYVKPGQLDDGRYYGFWQMRLTGYVSNSSVTNPAIILPADQLFIVKEAFSETIDDVRFIRESWKRYEQTEEIRYIDALARVYHDTVKDYSFKISGTGLGFYSPLDLINFTFIEGRQFMITNSSINIDLTETTLELVEVTKNNVTDYE